MKDFFKNLPFLKTAIFIFVFLVIVAMFFGPTKCYDFAKGVYTNLALKSVSWSTNLEDSDFVDVQIENLGVQKLERYSSKRPVKKKWVPVKIKIEGNYYPAKLKLNETNESIYEDDKYSYKIKLDNEAPYINNFRRFKLIKGEEVQHILALSHFGAKAGLIAATGTFKILRINGAEVGYYYMVEDIAREFLERRHGITNYAVISNSKGWAQKKENNHSSAVDFFSGYVEGSDDFNFSYALGQFKLLMSHVDNENINGVLNFLDKHYMAEYLALITLFNNIEPASGNNLKFIYDFGRGKFYPVYSPKAKGIKMEKPFNANAYLGFNSCLFESKGIKYEDSQLHKLYKLLISNDEFRLLRDEILYNYYANTKQSISIIDSINSKYHQMYAYAEATEKHYSEAMELRSILRNNLKKFYKYISKAHIYGSIDTAAQMAHITANAFAPIRILTKSAQALDSVVVAAQVDKELKHAYKIVSVPLPEFGGIDDFNFINTITGDEIKPKNVSLNYISESKIIFKNDLQALNANGIVYTTKNDTLIIRQGVYQVKKNCFLSEFGTTIIEPGTKLHLGQGVDFQIKGGVKMRGTEKKPIMITSVDTAESFGAFSIVGNGSSEVEISYLKVSNGSESLSKGIYFSGQFAVYNATVSIKNSTFSNSKGDDGINIKNSKVLIENCKFIDNYADQIDLDFCLAKMRNCTFYPQKIDANGDGLDLSGSYARVEGCSFAYFLDKGVSIGEKSTVILSGCNFKYNKNGIAIKDESILYSFGNSFSKNELKYTSYIKKKIFNGPNLYLMQNANDQDVNLISGSVNFYSTADFREVVNVFTNIFSAYRKTGSISDRNFFPGGNN